MSSHHYTDSGQKEEIPVESSKHVKGPQAENSLVDWKKGIMFYFRDEIFYREILQMFLDSHSDMELRRYYEESDFENYRIKIHAVKTNLANIGAMKVSEMAKQLELLSYVQKHHEEFMATYERVVSEVETYMESANSGFDSSREQPI